ncbi:MAG: RsmE family RNA methyltransferase [Akkermansiaceae bacterium]|nr:16S rRNA (uracil(1498)-N(3))-methyltransferase [Akkermansiaceae bacterium]
MDRFWISPAEWQAPFSLGGEEAHHCRRVMRKGVGDTITVFDGEGQSAEARITELSSNEVLFEISEERTSERGVYVELAVGIPKGKTFDLIIQKAVELGVSRIQPLMSDQGMVRIEGKDVVKKTEKWNRLALEASKQCGQNWLPEVLPPRSFSEWLPEREPMGCEIAAALTETTKPLREILPGLRKEISIRVLVGPEGDFSTEEYRSISMEDFSAVSLGNLVLRVETAAFFVLSNIFCQLE